VGEGGLSYIPLRTSHYARILDRTVAAYGSAPWDPEDVEMHLRYLAGEVAAGRMGPGRSETFPTSRELGAIFNWRHERVADFLKRSTVSIVRRDGVDVEVEHLHWQDPYQPIPLARLTGDRLVGVNAKATGRPRGGHGEATGRTEQPTESERQPNGKATGGPREGHAVRDTSARVPSTRYPDSDRGGSRAREAESSTDPTPEATEPGQPGAPPENLLAYLGPNLQAGAVALVRAGVETRTQLLALSLRDIQTTRGASGATAKRIAARAAEWGDRLGEDEIRPNGRAPPGRRDRDPTLAELLNVDPTRILPN
jgi:hypothetical protein